MKMKMPVFLSQSKQKKFLNSCNLSLNLIDFNQESIEEKEVSDMADIVRKVAYFFDGGTE